MAPLGAIGGPAGTRPVHLACAPQVDVHYHYECPMAYALYPMVALQRASFSDTEAVERDDDWNQDKLVREQELYRGAVGRNLLGGLLSGTATG